MVVFVICKKNDPAAHHVGVSKNILGGSKPEEIKGLCRTIIPDVSIKYLFCSFDAV